MTAALPDPLARWFAARDWRPRRHQLEMLAEGRAGNHALLVAATGAGKTLAGFLPTLAELIEEPTSGLHTLYVSPLKALAVDVQRNLLTPIEEMGVDILTICNVCTLNLRRANKMVKEDARLLESVNEELVKAGVMEGGEGLHPSSRGARVRFSGTSRTVIDGPFAETKELVAGFWLWKCASLQEAIDWVKRCPNPMLGESEVEIRQVFEAADFGEAFTPELRAQEDRLREELQARKG